MILVILQFLTKVFWQNTTGLDDINILIGKSILANTSGLPNILTGKSILGKYLWTAKVDDNLVKVLEVLHVT